MLSPWKLDSGGRPSLLLLSVPLPPAPGGIMYQSKLLRARAHLLVELKFNSFSEANGLLLWAQGQKKSDG